MNSKGSSPRLEAGEKDTGYSHAWQAPQPCMGPCVFSLVTGPLSMGGLAVCPAGMEGLLGSGDERVNGLEGGGRGKPTIGQDSGGDVAQLDRVSGLDVA